VVPQENLRNLKSRLHVAMVTTALIACAVTTAASAEDWAESRWSTATLSQARSGPAAASAGGKVFFGGGGGSDVVDIYDTTTDTWTAETLSVARGGLAAASAGGKVFFGGGQAGGYSDVVDIYDTATSTWSATTLSQPRRSLSATSAGGKVFFGGGYDGGKSDVVDIYDTATSTWSATTLSQPRDWLSAASAGGKVFFGGGISGGYSNVVDIYDTATSSWSATTLSTTSGYLSVTSVGDKVFFGGGYTGSAYRDVVDIYDTATDTWSIETLSEARGFFSATSAGGKAFFGGGYRGIFGVSDVVDIYDTVTDSWSAETLSVAREQLGATSAGNKVFFGGGQAGGPSDVVDIYATEQIFDSITSSKVFTLIDQSTVTGHMQQDAPGSLDLGAYNLTVGSMSGDAPINLNGNTLTVGVDNSSPTAYSGEITDGNLIKVGTGTLTLDGPLSVDLTISGGTVVAGDASSFAGFNYSGTLQIGANTATLLSLGYAQLGVLTTMAPGGVLTATNGVVFGTGDNFQGAGVVNGKVAQGFGSIIQATGNLILGDATSVVGFTGDGELHTGANAITLHDANQAVLGSLTNIGSSGQDGVLAAPNGLVVEFGKNIIGRGTINTPDDPTKPLLNNGDISDESLANPLVLTGYVKGAGTFSNFSPTGTFSPGLSPIETTVSNLVLVDTSTLLIELGGLSPGSEYDVLHVTGELLLDGTLEMVLINGFMPSVGDTFTIMTFDSATGDFDSYTGMDLGSGLSLEAEMTANAITLTAIPEPSAFVLAVLGLLSFGLTRRRRHS
jgi:hypothetical protein